MFKRGVNVSLSQESGKIKRGVVLSGMRGRGLEDRVFKKRTVSYGERYFWVMLINNPARTNRKVSHLAIALFFPGQSHGYTRGLESARWVVAFYVRYIFGVSDI